MEPRRLLRQLERRPEARVLADREIATHTKKLAFALVVGNLVGETQAAVRVGIEPGKSTRGQKNFERPAVARQVCTGRKFVGSVHGSVGQGPGDRALGELNIQVLARAGKRQVS